MGKFCLECNRAFVGREDKKFCCDGCRNAYNNKANKDETNLMRRINFALRKNYRILKDMNVSGKTRTSKSKLLGLDFNFSYFTSIYTTQAGGVYYFVYDQGYMFVDQDGVLLVKRD